MLSSFSRSIASVALLGDCAVAAKESKSHPLPPCRKQMDAVAMQVPTKDGGDPRPMLMLYGGRGYEWTYNKKTDKWELNGGKRNGTFMNDTWFYDFKKGHWHKPELSPATFPSSRQKAMSIAFNNERSYVLHAGCDQDGTPGVKDDLWVYMPVTDDAGGWHRVKTNNPPRARRGHILAKNSSHLLVFGGNTFNETKPLKKYRDVLVDFWALPLQALTDTSGTATWTRGPDFPGEARWGATGEVIKDKNGKEFMTVFGGRNFVWNFSMPLNGNYTYYNDIWLHDLEAGTWENVTFPEGVKLPLPRDHHSSGMTNNEFFVFGGRTKNASTPDAAVSDVWSFSAVTRKWTELYRNGTGKPGRAPQQRFGVGVDGLTLNGKEYLVVSSGESLPHNEKTRGNNDVWLFDLEERTWQELSKTDCSPEALYPDGPSQQAASAVVV